MSITRFVPRPGNTLLDLDRWIFAVTTALNALGGGGVSRETRSFTFNDTAPPTVTTPSSKKPTAVLLLAATLASGGAETISGAAITWTWAPSSSGGAILVSAIAGLTAATDYTVTVEIVGT